MSCVPTWGEPAVYGAVVRVFVAGASGAIGRRLVPLLVGAGHTVAGMTRHADRAPLLEDAGAHAVVCDVYDIASLEAAVVAFAPDAVVHQLTALPDARASIAEFAAANNRVRREGTHNLLRAAAAARARRFLAQSVAWQLPGDGGVAVAALERAVLTAGGVVLRYGQFFGPGTYYEAEPPPPPRIHVDEAARRTVELLDSPRGIIVVARG
jgi:nucleoside-diphosphate-sugar epimerase